MLSLRLSRRALMLAPLAALGGCQRSEVALLASVTPEAEAAFLRAIQTFAQTRGYRISGDNWAEVAYRNFELVGWRSKIVGWGSPGAGFTLSVRHKGDLWLMLIPSADLEAIAQAIETVLSNLEGVSVENGI